MNAAFALVFADPADRLCVLNITRKDKALRLVGFYAPSESVKRLDLFRRIELFLIKSGSVVLTDDWNSVLDRDIERIRKRLGTNYPDIKPFRKLYRQG